jgi:acetolactate decarboxylase
MVHGSLAMIAAATVASGYAAHVPAGNLYQTSLMSALIEGNLRRADALWRPHAHGDFGLGTFNDLDGEMVGFDGVFYQLSSDGSARPTTDDQKTPFAVLAFFIPDQSLALSNIEQGGRPSAWLPRGKTICSPRSAPMAAWSGSRPARAARSIARPSAAGRGAGQAETVLTDAAGTFAGFRTPTFARTLGVPARGDRDRVDIARARAGPAVRHF